LLRSRVTFWLLRCCRRSHSRSGSRRCGRRAGCAVGSGRDTSIAVAQEDIPIPNRAGGVSFLVGQEHISVFNSAECNLAVARAKKDVSVSDRTEGNIAAAIVKEHVSVSDRTRRLIAVAVADSYSRVLSNCSPNTD
jgi:hypothetical protein